MDRCHASPLPSVPLAGLCGPLFNGLPRLPSCQQLSELGSRCPAPFDALSAAARSSPAAVPPAGLSYRKARWLPRDLLAADRSQLLGNFLKRQAAGELNPYGDLISGVAPQHLQARTALVLCPRPVASTRAAHTAVAESPLSLCSLCVLARGWAGALPAGWCSCLRRPDGCAACQTPSLSQ